MIDTIYLMNRGFEIRQINQLVAIDELGYDLSGINPMTSVDTLKRFKEIILKKEYPDEYMEKIKELTDKGLDIGVFLKEKWDNDCFDYLARMLKAHIDISKIDKSFDRNQIKNLYVGSCTFGLNIPYLMNSKIPATVMDNTISILYNKKFKYGPIVREIFESNLSLDRIKTLISALYKSIDQQKEIDIRPIMNDKYNPLQLRVIIDGLFDDKNILDYCDERFNWLQMSCILSGLQNNVDISLFNKLRYNEYQMETILDWAMSLENKKDLELILNEKLNPAQMEFLISRKEAGIDISSFSDDKYTYEQMYAIYAGIQKGVDINIYKDIKFSGEEMYTIMNALIMQKEGYEIDINMFLNKEISLDVKLKELISKIDIPDINLNETVEDESLEEKLTVKYNIDGFYTYYMDRDDEEIIEVKLKNGNKIIFQPEELAAPSNPIGLFDEDYHMESYFIEKYEKEIEKLVEILSFIKYEDFQYHLYNLLTNEDVSTLEISLDGSCEYEIDRAYEEIKKETCYYLNEDEDYYFSPLFFDFKELANSGGPDIKKLVIQRPLNAYSDIMYAVAKDCKTEDISNVQKLFDEIYSSYYAFYAGDTFSYKILDKNDDVLEDGVWYGSFNLSERIEKEFKVEVLEIKDDHKNYERDEEELSEGWECEENEDYFYM